MEIYQGACPTTRPVATIPGAAPDAEWWRQAVDYQIYPRSFADSDADGLATCGVTSRIAYLAWLGTDAVWLSPFYPSALVDGGYDVDDYRDVDPLLGTLADFDELVAGLHASGIKVIIDIVPNHTSTGIPGSARRWPRRRDRLPGTVTSSVTGWARTGRGRPRTGTPGFGGAWERVPDGQWYLHLFAAQQPDLNWANRDVREDFLATLRFWSDRGVDGFRVDVAHGLAKNMSEPLEPSAIAGTWPTGRSRTAPTRSGTGTRCTRSTPSGGWCSTSTSRRARPSPRPGCIRPGGRCTPARGAGTGLQLRPARGELGRGGVPPGDRRQPRRGAAARRVGHLGAVESRRSPARHPLRAALRGTPRPANTRDWLLSGGTSPRLDRGLGLRRARAATLLVLALPGSAYLYQGEELGLHEVPDIPPDLLRDPVFARTRGGAYKGRDGCRVPLPWTVRRPFVRVRRRRYCAPPAAGLVRAAQRRGAAAGSGLHPGAVPAGTPACGTGCRRRKPRVDAGPQRAGAALRPPRRLAVGHQLRVQARPGPRRNPAAGQRARPGTACCPPTPPPGSSAASHPAPARILSP